MTPATLASTQRTLDWDELPPRVRQVHARGMDPGNVGVLMAHQSGWIEFRRGLDIAVAEKSRRSGITLSEALDDTLTAASAQDAGGSDVYYIGDTKEKGLEFIGYCAAFARVIARGQAAGAATGIEMFLFEDLDPDTGESRQITSYRIRFASGYQIVALSSRPANIRGLQGIVVIDEAAFHPDVQGVIDASIALLMWGGQIRVISTHNGVRNAFNELVRDIRAGRYGEAAGVYRITFDECVANGLYERRCWMKGTAATEAGKAAWYQRMRKGYGPRTAAMREELDVIPRDGSGSALPTVWIEGAMPAGEDRPVLRYHPSDDFVHIGLTARERDTAAWLGTEVAPVLARALRAHPGRWGIGMDYARHRNFSVIMPFAVDSRLRRVAPCAIEMANTPTAQQQQILWWLLDMLPAGQWTFAGDATGPGAILMENTADQYGRAIEDKAKADTYSGGPVHQITLSRAWYARHMPHYLALFEDGTITLPRDAGLEDDHRALQWIDGIPMVPKIETHDPTDAALLRHGDGAIAGALAEFACAYPVTTGQPPVTAGRLSMPGASSAGRRIF